MYRDIEHYFEDQFPHPSEFDDSVGPAYNPCVADIREITKSIERQCNVAYNLGLDLRART